MQAKVEQDYQTHIQFNVDQSADPALLQRAVSKALPRLDEEIRNELRKERGWETDVHSSIKLVQ